MSTQPQTEVASRNFTFGPHDLDDRDWVLGDSVEGLERKVLDVQGAQEVAIIAESQDDAAFDVTIQFNDEAGEKKVEVDSAMDTDLASTTPANGNHFVFVTVAIASRYVEVVLSDTSGGQNRVSGTVNFH